jgi:hypothetical protein
VGGAAVVELVLSCKCGWWWIDRQSSRHVASGDDNVGAKQDAVVFSFCLGWGVVTELTSARRIALFFAAGAECEIDSLPKIKKTKLTVLVDFCKVKAHLICSSPCASIVC